MVPSGKRKAIVEALDDEGIDYALTEEVSGREYVALVSFPLPTSAVEPVLERLREAGLERDAYTVVVNAETVVSKRYDRLEEQYAEETDASEDRIAREEIYAEALSLIPEYSTFVVMTVVSAVVATAGVLIDSPAVVVGSMVIAPLVGPAMATSVGTVVADRELFRDGVKQQTIGVLLATVSAAVFALFVKYAGLVPPNLDPTSLGQFSGRLTPDFLSLAVALGAGIAGAISLASGISVAIVGVMIAAALVPPIAVVGIGIAWGRPMTVLSSGVLVLVNVLSINLAALGVFWYRGYRPEDWFRQDAARAATAKRMGTLVAVIGVLSLFLGGVTYASYANAQYQSEVRDEIEAAVAEEQRLQYIDSDIQYDSDLPFKRPERVTVTVGRPEGVESPRLADRLQRRLAERSDPALGLGPRDPPVDVQVRYMEIQSATDRVADGNATAGGNATTLEPPASERALSGSSRPRTVPSARPTA
jgi:uncharacterized hydrophobic protein (TIGR00341 family)